MYMYKHAQIIPFYSYVDKANKDISLKSPYNIVEMLVCSNHLILIALI